MKKNKVFAAIVSVGLCLLVLFLCIYMRQTHYEINEEIPDGLNSGKSLAEYALNIVENNCGKEFETGSVYMILDPQSKGELEVTLVEKNKKKPMLAYVKFDTKSNKLLYFKYVGWDSKLHPGFIDIQNWKIDYAEALEISKEFHSKTEGFRYEDVIIKTCNSHPFEDEDWEDWSVVFRDFRNGKNYETRIDPYTGEILDHGIWEWLEYYS